MQDFAGSRNASRHFCRPAVRLEGVMEDAVNTRELALDILLHVIKQGGNSHTAIAGVLDKYQYLDKRDRAFLTRIAEGTLENLIRIDYMIDQFSKVPVRKIKPVICCILRCGVYQICFMDAVPDCAACDEAVRLAKKKGFKNLSGFVNGVLRNISRHKDAIVWPDKETQPVNWLSVYYSMPEWIIQLWAGEFGWNLTTQTDFCRMEQLLQAFAAPAPVTVRVNTARCTQQELVQRLREEGVTAVPCTQIPGMPDVKDALKITGYDHIRALSAFQEGLFYVQDISSMLAAQAAAPGRDDFVLDICAAPGGKAIHIAQLMQGSGHVLARDLTPSKIRLLEENIQRCQAANIKAEQWDARMLDQTLVQKADLVMADLPCSGLGVMRRKKEIRYRMTPQKIEELAKLQREILSVACRYVKPGGKLIYSTCTISRQENGDNVQWFLENYNDFRLLRDRQLLPATGAGDGFYIAEVQRVYDPAANVSPVNTTHHTQRMEPDDAK